MQVCVSPLHPCYTNSLTHSSLKPCGESHSLLNITLGSQKMTLSKEELKKAAQSHTLMRTTFRAGEVAWTIELLLCNTGA